MVVTVERGVHWFAPAGERSNVTLAIVRPLDGIAAAVSATEPLKVAPGSESVIIGAVGAAAAGVVAVVVAAVVVVAVVVAVVVVSAAVVASVVVVVDAARS